MKFVVRETVIVIGVALLAATLCAFFHPKRPAWYQVVSEDVKRWSIDEQKALELMAEGKVLWVDARKGEKFAEEHFPEAISLDLDNWADLLISQQEILQAAIGSPVIVYCDGTRCDKSKDVATKLRELVGLEPVYLLMGDWRKVRDSLK